MDNILDGQQNWVGFLQAINAETQEVGAIKFGYDLIQLGIHFGFSEQDTLNLIVSFLNDGYIRYTNGGKYFQVTQLGRQVIQENKFRPKQKEVLTMASKGDSESFDFWFLIHNDVRRVTEQKFIDGHYSDAVESAFKEVNSKIKKIVLDKTGEEKDGSSLMTYAFSLNKPLILLDDLNTMSGRDTQQGYMQIFAGAMTGIRNPKAHDNITTSKEKAIHFIFLASLLMIKIDDSK